MNSSVAETNESGNICLRMAKERRKLPNTTRFYVEIDNAARALIESDVKSSRLSLVSLMSRIATWYAQQPEKVRAEILAWHGNPSAEIAKLYFAAAGNTDAPSQYDDWAREIIALFRSKWDELNMQSIRDVVTPQGGADVAGAAKGRAPSSTGSTRKPSQEREPAEK